MKRVFILKGMHCPACAQRLTEAFLVVPGVKSAHVTLNPPEAHVETDGALMPEALDAAARSAGDYTVVREKVPSAPIGESHQHAEVAVTPEKKESLYPLILIVAYITGVVLLIEAVSGTFFLHRAMRHFMAGFFLVFSFFKFLDLRGFADAYRTYDVVAKKAPVWGGVYPFVELALGIAYLVRWNLTLTNVVTLAVMLVSSVGVFKALLNKRTIRCACLGTVLNLPMTTVTLVEDLGMAAMAAVMLFM